MIGVIDKKLIFEFRDGPSFVKAIMAHMEGCKTVFIADKNDKVKAIIRDNKLEENATIEEKEYSMYGTNDTFNEISMNDFIPENVEWAKVQNNFTYKVYPVPMEV